MKAANDRVRVRVNSENDFDISFAPLSYWRKNWADKEFRRQFIEDRLEIKYVS